MEGQTEMEGLGGGAGGWGCVLIWGYTMVSDTVVDRLRGSDTKSLLPCAK